MLFLYFLPILPEIVEIKAGYRCLCKTEMKPRCMRVAGGILQKSEAVLVVVDDAVREINEQLGEATLGGGIVTKDGREGGVTEWLWKTLA